MSSIKYFLFIFYLILYSSVSFAQFDQVDKAYIGHYNSSPFDATFVKKYKIETMTIHWSTRTNRSYIGGCIQQWSPAYKLSIKQTYHFDSSGQIVRWEEVENKKYRHFHRPQFKPMRSIKSIKVALVILDTLKNERRITTVYLPNITSTQVSENYMVDSTYTIQQLSHDGLIMSSNQESVSYRFGDVVKRSFRNYTNTYDQQHRLIKQEIVIKNGYPPPDTLRYTKHYDYTTDSIDEIKVIENDILKTIRLDSSRRRKSETYSRPSNQEVQVNYSYNDKNGKTLISYDPSIYHPQGKEIRMLDSERNLLIKSTHYEKGKKTGVMHYFYRNGLRCKSVYRRFNLLPFWLKKGIRYEYTIR